MNCNSIAHETAMKKVLDQMEKEMQEAKLKWGCGSRILVNVAVPIGREV